MAYTLLTLKIQTQKLIKTVETITPELKNSLNGKSKLGRGGIQSKIKAAEIATSCGITVVIANSRRENVILDILAGKEVGTYFKPSKTDACSKTVDSLWCSCERTNPR